MHLYETLMKLISWGRARAHTHAHIHTVELEGQVVETRDVMGGDYNLHAFYIHMKIS